MMREFGPNPHLGAEYRGQLLEVRARNGSGIWPTRCAATLAMRSG